MMLGEPADMVAIDVQGANLGCCGAGRRERGGPWRVDRVGERCRMCELQRYLHRFVVGAGSVLDS